MKKRLHNFTTVITFLFISTSGLYGFTGDGKGTHDEPYEITSVEQLQEMKNDLSAHYILMGDIDASSTSSWNFDGEEYLGFLPVGDDENPFTGSLDGQGYTITGLYIERPGRNYVGLFGYIGEDGEVRDVRLIFSVIAGNNHVGGLAGSNLGTIKNSYTRGAVNQVQVEQFSNASDFDYTIPDEAFDIHVEFVRLIGGGGSGGGGGGSCYIIVFTGSWYSGGGGGAGGHGYSWEGEHLGFEPGDHLQITRAAGRPGGSGGAVDESGSDGQQGAPTIFEWTQAGSTTTYQASGGGAGGGGGAGAFGGAAGGTGGEGEGGNGGSGSGTTGGAIHSNTNPSGWEEVIGSCGNASRGGTGGSSGSGGGTAPVSQGGGWWINFTYSMQGKVTGTGMVGGLTGSNAGTIYSSYSTGDVSGADVAGGLVGLNDGGMVQNSYSTGTVIRSSGTESAFGGFVGNNNEGSIVNSYSTGQVTYANAADPTDKGFAGAVVTTGDFEMSGNFWDTQTSGQSSTACNATGRTTAQMQQQSTFDPPWDFGATWHMFEGVDYPWLMWQPGTTANPIVITNVNELQDMNQNLIANYALGNDIDASETVDWNEGAGFIPVGDNTNRFTGSLDGQGYTITGLHINRPATNHIGLFGYMDGAVVKNVGLVEIEIDGHTYVGGLAGYNAGSVNESYSCGTVNGVYRHIGGVVGYNTGMVTNSYSAANVIGNDYNTGGLVGGNYGGTVDNAFATGTITGNFTVGGLLGYNDGTVTTSYATGTVHGGTSVGGLVGISDSEVFSSYATGDVSGLQQVGGFAGLVRKHTSNIGTVQNCYSTGAVTRVSGSGSLSIGGFVGENSNAIVINCYSKGNVGAEDGDPLTASGFVGSVSTSGDYEMTGNFWNIETSLQSSSAGSTDGGSELPQGLTTAEMRQQETFTAADWDFPGTWSIISEDGSVSYPYLTGNFKYPYPGLVAAWNGDGSWDDEEYWFENTVPGEGADVRVHTGHLTLDQSVDVVVMTVAPSASLTLEAGNTLSASKLVMESEGKEVAEGRDNISVASFVNLGTVDTDVIEYQRYVPAGAFEYISSPLIGQKSEVFAPLSDVSGSGRGLFTFDNAEEEWHWIGNDETVDLNPMQGFAYISDEAVTITFSGDALYTGNQSITLDRNDEAAGFNLVGNPYAASVDWGNPDGWARDEGNPEPSVSPVVWINYADDPGEGNFASFNYLTPEAHVNWEGNVGVDLGVIPPTQAFWVLAEDDGAELTVKPGAQVHSANVVQKKSTAPTLNPMLRLQAERDGYTDEMVVLFHESATEGYDRYDTRKKMGSGNFPQLYTSVSGTDLAVNALPDEMLAEGLVIPLTLRFPAKGDYTISLTELRAFDVFTEILLADRQKDVTVNLRERPVYSFDLAATGDVTGRFELIIGDNTVTGVEDLTSPKADIYSHGRLVYISGAGIGDRWEILNMMGVRLLEGQTDVDGTSVIGTNIPVGIYMVVLHTGEGRVVKRVYIE